MFMVVLMVCTVGMTMGFAQKMEKGMSLFNIGLGFVPGVGASVSYDYGLVDSWGPGIFTIGGFAGFNNYSFNSDIRGTDWLIAPRATYRYPINNSFEVYGSAMFSVAFTTYSEIKSNTSEFFPAAVAGCRYTFANNLSVFAEVGYNVSILNGGLSIAF